MLTDSFPQPKEELKQLLDSLFKQIKAQFEEGSLYLKTNDMRNKAISLFAKYNIFIGQLDLAKLLELSHVEEICVWSITKVAASFPDAV